jgi:hypothetical protein
VANSTDSESDHRFPTEAAGDQRAAVGVECRDRINHPIDIAGIRCQNMRSFGDIFTVRNVTVGYNNELRSCCYTGRCRGVELACGGQIVL